MSVYLYKHTFSQRTVHVPDGYLRAYIFLYPGNQRQCTRLITQQSRINRHQVSHWPVACRLTTIQFKSDLVTVLLDCFAKKLNLPI